MVIFELKIRLDKNTMTNIMNKSTMEQTRPSAETGTGFWNTRVNKNQGSGKLQKTKKKEEISTLFYFILLYFTAYCIYCTQYFQCMYLICNNKLKIVLTYHYWINCSKFSKYFGQNNFRITKLFWLLYCYYRKKYRKLEKMKSTLSLLFLT